MQAERGTGGGVSATGRLAEWGPALGVLLFRLAFLRGYGVFRNELFESVEEGAVFNCRDCMPYESGRTIWIARGLRAPIAELWPRIKRFI
jgi:hypothetical protein